MQNTSRVTAIVGIVLMGAVACGGNSSGGGGTAQVKSQGNGAAAIVSTHAGPAGTYLTDGKGRTLYLWKADTGSTSTCNGACAGVWAPYTTSGTPKAAGKAQQSMLGTTSRSDGSTEVTYADHPLYYYAGDSSTGDMNGQGSTQYGNTWWVVAPNGSAITSSGKSGGSSGSSPSKSSYSWG
jgi:predicted lipoprotein with Yx(FWY)xxD motif